MVIDRGTKEIVCVAVGKGREHDFGLFKRSQVRPHPQTECLGDRGYQGLKKRHTKSRTPYKRSRRKELFQEQRRENRALASDRVVVEHVVRRLKVFRVLSSRYRHRRRRFGLRLNLIAALYNRDLATA